MSIEARIHAYVVSELLPNHYADLSTDQPLLGILDSLDMESMICFLEEEFGIEVDPIDLTLEHFQSVKSIAAYVGEELAAQDHTEAKQ